MTIDEMRKHKKELEARLRNVSAEIVDEFQRRTGLYVRGVAIDLTDVTAVGDETRRSSVTDASLRIDL